MLPCLTGINNPSYHIFSCAFWPEGDCDNSTVFVEPCKAPKTVGVELDTCNAQYNRDLHATSHMIAWAGICMGGVLLVGVFVIQKSLSPYSYLQTMWVGEYRKVVSSLLLLPD